MVHACTRRALRMPKRPSPRKTTAARPRPAKKAGNPKPPTGGVARKLDPTKPAAARERSGVSTRRPAVQAFIRKAQGSLPVALLRRFIDADLMSQAAALALYALLSLAPLLLILVWFTTSILPIAQEAVMQQIALLVGTDAERVARTIVANARDRP